MRALLLIYVRRSVVAATAVGATNPITYVMARSDRELPPPDSYLRCIEEGYRYWSLPLDELERAVQEAHAWCPCPGPRPTPPRFAG